jgi:hypothetical protein
MINNEPRYASLSSGLLARKGAAKPAMRPQGFGMSGQGFEDLGWNDMGFEPAPVESFEPDLSEHVPSSISALTPSPKLGRAEEPEVVAQQRAIAENFPPEAEPEAAEPPMAAEVVRLPKRHALPEVAPPRAVAAPAEGRKAAFTLRLDAERHLRLRLACAVTGRSAQQIVTGALDALLDSIPELESLAERVPSAAAKRN